MSNTPLFVHSSIDDAGLSPGALRVLGHLMRLAGRNGEAYYFLWDISLPPDRDNGGAQ
jgi:hypothetical protein